MIWRIAVALVLVSVTIARADSLVAEDDQPIIEKSHLVDVTVDGDGVATYKVQREIANVGKEATEVTLTVDLPPGGAVTGLRIKSGTAWSPARLLEAGKASELYDKPGKSGPSTVLAGWIHTAFAEITILTIVPGGSATVEYTVTGSTQHVDGRTWLFYPRVENYKDGAIAATPMVTVRQTGTAPVFIDGMSVAPNTPIALAPPVVQPDWFPIADVDPTTAGYATGTVTGTGAGTTTTATLELDVQHPAVTDLRIQLLTPAGEAVTLVDRDVAIAKTITVTLPSTTAIAGTWRLVASDREPGDTGSIASWRLRLGSATYTGERLQIPDVPAMPIEEHLATISITPKPVATWTARLGRVVAGTHAFSRVEIDVGALSTLPHLAQIVFVVDVSYSAGDELVGAQLSIIKAYLAHVPDAQFEIVTYRRTAKRVFGTFAPASDAGKLVDDARRSGAFALGNGSALDEAAKLAVTLLAGRSGAHRLVLATDSLVRTSLTTEQSLAVLATLPKDAVVHVVLPDTRGSLELRRDDEHALAPLATAHHGIFTHASGFTGRFTKPVIQTALELVRPLRIDKLAATGVELEASTLDENDGLRQVTSDKTAPTRITLTGLVWSDPVRKDIVATDAFSRTTAALLFGSDDYEELTNKEMMTVALLGHVVSPVTSLIATGSGQPAHGRGHGGSWGHGGRQNAPHVKIGQPRPRPQSDLRSLIDPKSCTTANPASPVTLAIETTRDEIVDVAVTAGAGPFANCLVETVWNLRLDPKTFKNLRDLYIVAL